jgi:hypothetical protein
MGTRYIEINSAYRNRDEYPEVSEFVIPFSVDSSSVMNTSYISDAFPLYQFTSGLLNATGVMITASTSNPAIDSTIHVDNAYVGYKVSINNNPPTNQNLLVSSYNASTSVLKVTPNVVPSSSNPIIPYTTTYDMEDQSPSYDATNGTYSYVVQYRDDYNRIPTGGANIFAGYFIVFEPYWTPYPAYPTGLYWDYSKISSYDQTINSIVTDKNFLNVAPPPWPFPPTGVEFRYTVRKSLPLQKGQTTAAASQNQVYTAPIPGLKEKDYEGLLLYIIPIKSTATNPANYTGDEFIYPDVSINRMTFDQYVYPIKKRDPITGLTTLAKKLNNDLYFAPLGMSNPATVRPYEILPVPRTSSFPLSYSGSLVSQAEVTCYEVELLDLILPNVILSTGSPIIKYPYVYVVLKTDGTDFKVGRNIITSNNPNSYEATFVCGVTNIVDPTQARFVKIDAMGMTQTIKFKPNSSLYFKVYLPDGTLFKPAEVDYPSPLPPNPLLQIEAIFGVRRL